MEPNNYRQGVDCTGHRSRGGGGGMTQPGPAGPEPAGPLRVGILGAGMIATAEPGYLPGLRQLPGRVAVTAIASRTRARAERVARDWDIPVVCDDLGGLLARADVDAVVNLTPITDHYQTSLRVLAAGK